MQKPANDNTERSNFDDFHRLRQRDSQPFRGFLRRSPSIVGENVTAAFLGDPPPGRSALDMRKEHRAMPCNLEA